MNSAEYRKYVDNVLKEELGFIYIGVHSFAEVFFGQVAGLSLVVQAVLEKCKEGDNPLYQEIGG